MNVCDILKKQILSRSIVYLLINNDMYPAYSVITEEIYKEIQKLLFAEQLEIFNFNAYVSTIAYDYISYSVGYSLGGQLMEAKNIRVDSIGDQQLYEMIVKTFICVVFYKEIESKQQSIIELCINDKSIFNQLIETCLNLNFLNVHHTCHSHDEYVCANNNIRDDEYDDYDDGYDSVS